VIPVLEKPGSNGIFLRGPATDHLDFELPPELEAGEPPEARGLERDQVRLLVSHYRGGAITHTRFRQLPEHLRPGDVLAINTSGTLNAAMHTTRQDGTPLELHLSTRLPADLWVVELRRETERGTQPFFDARPGEHLRLPGGGRAVLLAPYDPALRGPAKGRRRARLWLAALDLPTAVGDYLDEFGFPIRYGYVRQRWPLSAYQNVYLTEKGSAEMPSAGRAFTPELITRLVARGVQFAPLLLHTGVASLEVDELPHEEYYRVPPESARVINSARAAGGRLIAVGTTSVRALETVADERGKIHPGEGWTRLVITAGRGLRSVDGLLTGFHEPHASHLGMLAALAGLDHLRLAYREALAGKYLWHEFGDLHLILP
jgi:S-adenosylmethionine:tRNA ribosyltransferase-isomerase